MQVAKHYITTWWLGGRFNGTGRGIDFVPVRGIWNQWYWTFTATICNMYIWLNINIYSYIPCITWYPSLPINISTRLIKHLEFFVAANSRNSSELASSCSTVLSQDYPRLLWWKLWNCAEVFCGFRDCWKLSKCKDVRDTNRYNQVFVYLGQSTYAESRVMFEMACIFGLYDLSSTTTRKTQIGGL